MQMYTDCTFVPLRVKYHETRTGGGVFTVGGGVFTVGGACLQ